MIWSKIEMELAWWLKLTCLLLIPILSLADQNSTAQFIGSDQCKNCHLDISQKWESSHHYKSMQIVTDETVLGNFDNQTLVSHDITHKLFKRNKEYFINTLDSESAYQDFKIVYTFGFYPLQQYLVKAEDGKLQALNIAWDSRPEVEGGQRWFHLHPDEDITPEHPFHWSNHFANWNSRCAECHSTNLNKNYDSSTNEYATSFSEINVACEACHGPASKHLSWAKHGQVLKNKGFDGDKNSPISWIHDAGQPIARPKGLVSQREVNMCGACHSRRIQIDKAMPLDNFHNHYAIETLSQDLYFADGQIKDEVFVLGSFLQSKMYRAGVTCSNCHDPHSSKLKIEGNGLCSQCHAPSVFDSPSHHRHIADSEGAACVNCHMPARTYMQVDDRRDHSFVIPNPLISAETGAPDICLTCHSDQATSWSASIFKKWGIESKTDHWAFSHFQANRLNLSTLDDLIRYANDIGIADITRATLVENLAAFSAPKAIEAVLINLNDDSPLVRRAAVEALRTSPEEIRWRALSPMLRDESKSVRMQTIRVLAPLIRDLPKHRRTEMIKPLAEYREFLKLHGDTPSGQLELASLEVNMENRGAALLSYQQALKIDRNHVATLVNLADFYRGSGLESKGENMLLRALRVAPDSAAVNHSYGLLLVREQRYGEALSYLEKGAQLANGQPRFAYIYAIALDSMGKTEKSVEFLFDIIETWPNQLNLLMTLVNYLEKLGREEEILLPLGMLQSFAPNVPEVQILVRKYSLDVNE